VRLPEKFSARAKKIRSRTQAILAATMELTQAYQALPDDREPPGIARPVAPQPGADNHEGGDRRFKFAKVSKELMAAAEEGARGDGDVLEIARELLARFGPPRFRDGVKDGAVAHIGDQKLELGREDPPIARTAVGALRHYMEASV